MSTVIPLMPGPDGVYIVAQDKALQDATILHCNLIQASSTNQRDPSEMETKALQPLADNIKQVGVMQPIVVRPIDAPRGQPQFEVVAGERRWRASMLAGINAIPARVKYLTDFEALQLQVFENLHRKDLHPLREAEGYAALLLDAPHQKPKLQGLTMDELMARTGKSKSYLYQRLALLQLTPEAKKAFYAGDLSASTAMLVARLQPTSQAEACKRIKQGWGGEPMSFKQASQFVHDNYMLSLTKAPFKITDASLVPDAGSCRECPKRTGANPELFDDVKTADTCTDAACFNAKKEAHQLRLVEAAKAEGVKVITGKEAKKIIPDHYGHNTKGFLQLDKVHYNINTEKPLSKLLGGDAPQHVLVENPHTKELVAMVPEEQALQVLKDRGVIKQSRMPTTSASQRENDTRRKVDSLWRRETATDLLQALLNMGGFDLDHAMPDVIKLMAMHMWKRLGSDDTKRVETLLGWVHLGYAAGPTADEDRIKALTGAELDRLIAAMILAPDLYVSMESSQPLAHPPRIMAMGQILGYDVDAMKAERLKDIKDALKPPAAKKPAKASTKAPSKPAAKASKKTPVKPAAKSPEPAAATESAPADKATPTLKPHQAWPFPGTHNAKFWPDQFVKIKGTKKTGQVLEVKPDGVIEVATESSQPGTRNISEHAAHELEALPGQVHPAFATEQAEETTP
jgi:ParB/RepB/Spo0J family partition protein